MKRKIIRTFLKRRKQALDEPTRRAKAKVRAEKVGHPYNLPKSNILRIQAEALRRTMKEGQKKKLNWLKKTIRNNPSVSRDEY